MFKAKLISSKNIILLTILALPSYVVRFSVWGISTNVLEVLISMALIVWLAEKGSAENIRKSFEKIRESKFRIPILLIFLGVFLSAVFGENARVGLGVFKGWFVFPGILAFLIGNVFESDQEKEEVLEYFYYSAFLVALVSLGYFLNKNLTYDGRLRGFYLSPNHLAMYLSPAFIFGVLRGIPENKKQFERRFWLLAIFFIGVCIYLTYSYAAWLAIVGAFTTGACLKVFSKKKVKRKHFWVGVIVLVALVLFQINTPKMKSLVSFEERSSLSSRVMIWESALKIAPDHWLVGIGGGNFQNKYLEYQKYFPPYLEWAVPQPHNIFLAFWIQGGILGLVGFVWLLVLWTKDLVLVVKKGIEKSTSQKTAFAVLLIVLYVLIHGLVDTTYWKNDLAVIFWMLFAIS